MIALFTTFYRTIERAAGSLFNRFRHSAERVDLLRIRLLREYRTMVKLLSLSVIPVATLMPLDLAAQDDPVKNGNGRVIYTFLVNVVPENFPHPLVGFVNIAGGEQYSANFGFVNVVEGTIRGPQVGYVNVAGGSAMFQGGFVNVAGISSDAIQVGFVNSTTERVAGMQAGFVNSAGTLSGVQLGFVNRAERVDGGIPLGFLSFVGEGGYRSLEFSFSGMTPFSVSFRTGIEQLYTFIGLGLSAGDNSHLMTGFGVGSMIFLNDGLFINPEISQHSVARRGDYFRYVQLIPSIGYSQEGDVALIAGPTFSWSSRPEKGALPDPFFSLYHNRIDNRNRFDIGLKVGIRFRFHGV